jgi:nitroreductase
MYAIEAMYKRRSIRKYKDRVVEREKLDKLLSVAMAAPTAMNSKPWHFVVVDDKEKMNGLRDVMEYGKYNAPAAIVVCGDMKETLPGANKNFWIQDCSSALTNILNGAVELGLDTVWLGAYPKAEQVKDIMRYFNMPENIVPLGVVYVGYGGEEKEARTQFDSSKVSYQSM